jgi:hypothetical protein
MARDKNIVHQYFRKETAEGIILVKVNPIHWRGTEIFIDKHQAVSVRELEWDEEIFEDLKHDGFASAQALEFNLYLSGLK